MKRQETQIELTSEIEQITAEELARRQQCGRETEKDREFRCPICEARCTEALSSSDEYGHFTDCPRRPDHLPRGGKKGDYIRLRSNREHEKLLAEAKEILDEDHGSKAN